MPFSVNSDNVSPEIWARWDLLCDEFEAAWRGGQEPRMETFLDRVATLERPKLLSLLLPVEWEHRQSSTAPPRLLDYTSRLSDYWDVVESAWREWESDPPRSPPSAAVLSSAFQHSAREPVEPPKVLLVTAASPSPPLSSDPNRYRKIRMIGQGGFGIVWLAEDLELGRNVAVKEPRAERLSDPRQQETYLAEARLLASLDHPHIVPVYDAVRTPEGSCYVVSKLIDGVDLATHAQQTSLSFDQIARLIQQIAEGLQHTHNRGLVHRDIKPGNLLIDRQGHPYITDFGLAMREEDFGQGPRQAGTWSYMSPEQARGEGHRVDGRSDIFSLGVVMYELLTGARPFAGDDRLSVLKQIRKSDPQPLHERNPKIPRELERICLKALAKRAADRYACALDLADDLGQWQVIPSAGGLADIPSRIVPRGMRSFEATDCDFFLDLVPGTRDRDGLPESLRFWKSRLEELDPHKTFRVGLLYGPSGCGKSSLLKAGLLPRLAEHVRRVFVEATPDQTEHHLLQGLWRACPDLPREASLVAALAAIRRGRGLPAGRKLVLILDQFEQWLYSHGGLQNTELAAALRQCDGERVQGVLLVRDDFWMPATRLFQELEIPLVEGNNAGAVDLFDPVHARKVLAEFGKAYGRLPENLGELSVPQRDFLEQAVQGLTHEGQVICVRLALFADMLQGRPWTPASLREVGGAAGVGVAFLEETFSSRTAPPQHRQHGAAARDVLRVLLPGTGTDIKGHRRAARELQEACGYLDRPGDFEVLLNILDRQVRLITPVTTEGQEPAYQLTHDYLVPSLRDWLTRKQQETPQGRAELLLAERTSLWNEKPEDRHLPTLLEHLRIRRWMNRRRRSEAERKMLSRAAVVHGRRLGIATMALVFLVAAAGWLWQERRQREAVAQVQVLESAVAADWNRTFDTLRREGLAKRAEGPFRERLAEAEAAGETLTAVKMRTGLLATQGDTSQVKPLGQALLTLPAAEFGIVRELLAAAPVAKVVSTLWEQAMDKTKLSAQQRFQAAAALARLAQDDTRWSDLKSFIAWHLTSLPAADLVAWRPMFEPVSAQLCPALVDLLAQPGLDPIARRSTVETLARYAVNDGTTIAVGLVHCEPHTFEFLFSVAVLNANRAIERFEQEMEESLPDSATVEERDGFHVRKSRAAVALARLGRIDAVWPWMIFDPQPGDPQSQDPSLRTELIHALSEYRVPMQRLVDRLSEGLHGASKRPRDMRETSLQRALLLALGRYTGVMSTEDRDRVLERLELKSVFMSETDPGIHSACEWLLRRWGQSRWLESAQADLAVQSNPDSRAKLAGAPGWFVNSQRQTFVVVPPAVFTMGSPLSEKGRSADEIPHRRKIERRFAIATSEMTRAQYAVFAQETNTVRYISTYSNSLKDPQTTVSWLNAVKYCNWLSEQEKLDPCYQIHGSDDSLTITMAPNYLDLNGYRLPTEAEWEYACRSGVTTAWGTGITSRRLRYHAWFEENGDNHLWPVCRLFPNDFGLFDMAGNAGEWCQDRPLDYPTEESLRATTTDQILEISMNLPRAVRGGAFASQASYIRSASRGLIRPDTDMDDLSFRLARTLP
jgi:serine/threonine protein kinase/formylglycine-generating enzyme required for sulfatase activity